MKPGKQGGKAQARGGGSDGGDMVAEDPADAELRAMIAAGLIDPEDLILKKKKKLKKPKQVDDYWDSLGDWQSVSAGDDFLLGAAEGGFAGLEILEGCTIIDNDIAMAIEANNSNGEPTPLAQKAAKRANTTPAATTAPAAAPALVAAAGPAPLAGADAADAAGSEEQERAARKRQRAQRAKLKRKERILRKKRKKTEVGQIEDRIGALELSGTGATVACRGGGPGEGKESEDADEEEWTGSQDGVEQSSGMASPPGSTAGVDQKPAGSGGAILSKKERLKIARTRKRALRKQQRLTAVEEDGSGTSMAIQLLKDAGKGGAAGGAAADISEWRTLLLHPLIEEALSEQGFARPTPIQRECLPVAIRDRSDIIGAAQTGSGKTLAFGLPIMQLLMQEKEVLEASGAADLHAGKLRALIMCPTRELALQVCEHMQAVGKVCGIKVGAIVGGLAHVKQSRILASQPHVIVATPGRLWELMRDNDAHLSDLSHLSFLVLDEADRMVQQGHYAELTNILELIPRPGEVRKDTSDPDFEEAFRKDTERLQHHRAPRGSSKPRSAAGTHASDADDERDPLGKDVTADTHLPVNIDAAAAAAAADDGDDDGSEEADEEGGGDEDEKLATVPDYSMDLDYEMEGDDGNNGDGGGAGDHAAGNSTASAAPEKSTSRWPPRRRQQHKGGMGHVLQTFVFSATLTLPTELRRRLRKGGGGAQGSGSLEGLMDKLVFRGEPHIIDLTTQRRLTTRLEEAKVECSDKERDEFLYYLLAMHPGRTIVFVNAVSALRRVAAILKILGLPTSALHAQQQQRQRLKALDKFKSQTLGVLVATDVAARGLDIKGVRCVIHYQLPASADTYIHRSGRTARAEADGLSIAIVTPKEAARFSALCRTMGRDAAPPTFPVEMGLMPQVHKRMALAMKVDELERKERRNKADRSWMEENSKLLDMEYSGSGSSDGEIYEDLEKRRRGGPGLETLQKQLSELLALPLQQRMSSKFFTGGAASNLIISSTRGGPKAAETQAGETPAQVVAVVPKAVALARRMQESKDAMQQQVIDQKAKSQAHSQRKKEGKAAHDAKLANLSARQVKISKKEQAKVAQAAIRVGASKGRGRGLVVIPPIALGRNKDGPEALDALRKRLSLLGA